jgi:carbon-monoxide dehydrogenase medium subunit
MTGNQSLSIVMSNRLANPEHGIDLNGITEPDYIEADDEHVEVGAMARHRDIETSSVLAEELPVLPASAEQISGPVVHNRGTLGRSVGEANPAGNYPCVLVAMDGALELSSVDGTRTVDAADCFVVYMKTGREEVRVGYANAADVPLRIEAVEAEIEGEPLSEESLKAAGDLAYDEVRPRGEIHADETHKRELARDFTGRVFRQSHDHAIAEPATAWSISDHEHPSATPATRLWFLRAGNRFISTRTH